MELDTAELFSKHIEQANFEDLNDETVQKIKASDCSLKSRGKFKAISFIFYIQISF